MNMWVEDVIEIFDLVLQVFGCDQVYVVYKLCLFSDNGLSYVLGDLVEWLQDKGMKYFCGVLYYL